MDEEFDIYGDLEEFDYKLKYSEQVCVIDQLQIQLHDALTKLEVAEREKNMLTKRVDNMGNSFQSLLNTARAEIKRKDAQIEELRREKDNIIFRRGIPGQKRVYPPARPTLSSENKAEQNMSELNGGESLPPSRVNPFRRQSRDQRASTNSSSDTRLLNIENPSVQFCDLTHEEDKNNDHKILCAAAKLAEKGQNTAKACRVLDKPKIIVDLCNNETDVSDEDIKIKTEVSDLSKPSPPQLNATHGTKQVPLKDRVIVKEEQVEPARTNSRPINETDRFNRKSRDQRLNKDDAVHLPCKEYRIKNERNSPEGNSREINSREKNPTETSVRDSYNSKERHDRDRKYEQKEIDRKEQSSRGRDRSYVPKEKDHRDTKLRNTKDTITDDRYRRDSDKREITDRRSRESRDQQSKDGRSRQQYKSRSSREKDRYDSDRRYDRDRDLNKKSQDYADKNYKSTSRERRNSRSDRTSSKDERSRRDYDHVDDSEMRSLKRRHDTLEESSNKRQRTDEDHNRRGRTRNENRNETETKKTISNFTTERPVKEPASYNHVAKERRKTNDNVAEKSKNDRESEHSKISARYVHPHCMENASEEDLLQLERKLQEEIFGAANDPENCNENKYTEHTDDEIFNQDCGKIQQELSDGEIVDDDVNYEVLPAVKAKSKEKCLDNSKSSRDSQNGHENLIKKTSDPSNIPSKCKEQLEKEKFEHVDPGPVVESTDVGRCEQPKENTKLNATKADDKKIEPSTVVTRTKVRKKQEPIKVTESKRQQKEEKNVATNCTSLEPATKNNSIASSEQLPETVKRKTPLKTRRRISVNRNRKSISDKLNICAENGILTLSENDSTNILETIFPDSPTKPTPKSPPINRNLKMEGHKIGFEPKKRSENSTLDTSRELKNELFKEILGPFNSTPIKTDDEALSNDLNRSLPNCTGGHESAASNEKEAVVNAEIKENRSHSKEPCAEQISEPPNATNIDNKEESVSFDWSTENNCSSGSSSATYSSSGTTSSDNSTSHDAKESNAPTQTVNIAKSNSEAEEKNKEILESQAAGPVSFKTKKRKAMNELKLPNSEVPTLLAALPSVLKSIPPEVVLDATELRNDETMEANYSRDIIGAPETDHTIEEKTDCEPNLRSSRDVIENVEHISQECDQTEIKNSPNRLDPIESEEIRHLDYVNDSLNSNSNPIPVPDDQCSIELNSLDLQKEYEQYKIDQLANNESDVDDKKNSNKEESVALDLTKKNSTKKADKKWEKHESRKIPKFEILDMQIIQKGEIFEEINTSKDATELCDKINRALSRISEKRESPQTENEPTNESSNNDLNNSTDEKRPRRRQSTTCNKSVPPTKSQPVRRTRRIARKPSTNGTRQLAELCREDSSIPTTDSENLKQEEHCRQMEVDIEAFITESHHFVSLTFDKSPDRTRDTSTENTTILDHVDQMTPSEACKSNETVIAALSQETSTEPEEKKIDPVLDTLPAVTCTSSSNSQLNSSNSEKQNFSIASSNYVIETVSPNVVNVFITRKKVKKKKKS